MTAHAAEHLVAREGGPFPKLGGLELRNAVIVQLAQAHKPFVEYAVEKEFPWEAERIVWAALRTLPARAQNHDKAIYETVRELIKAVGAFEATLAVAFPNIENDCLEDPLLLDGLAAHYENEDVSYGPGVVAGVITRAIDAGAGEELVAAIVRDAFYLCHWPSWRRIAALHKELGPYMQAIEQKLTYRTQMPTDGAFSPIHALKGAWHLIPMPPLFGEADF